MDSQLISVIKSEDAAIRDTALAQICRNAPLTELLSGADGLDTFRRQEGNLYHRVRALFFLYDIHRFHLPEKFSPDQVGKIPFEGYEHLLKRRFQEAIDIFLAAMREHGPGDALSSALASAYHQLAFQTLADQVRKSVRTVRGNQWMFRMGHPADQPLRIRKELLQPLPDGSLPILRERTPVRMDL